MAARTGKDVDIPNKDIPQYHNDGNEYLSVVRNTQINSRERHSSRSLTSIFVNDYRVCVV